jgi:hypothetical protein
MEHVNSEDGGVPASRVPVLPSADEIMDVYLRCHVVATALNERYKGRSGRRHKHDQARYKFLTQVVMPDLSRGKIPSEYDMRMLELPPPKEMSPNDVDKKAMDDWSDKHGMDPRQQPSESSEEQTTLLRYFQKFQLDRFNPIIKAPRGGQLVHKVDFGVHKGKTIPAMVVAAQLKDTGYKESGWLSWVCGMSNTFPGESFSWNLPKHLPLFSALRQQEKMGAKVMDSARGAQRGVLIPLKIQEDGVRAYEAFVKDFFTPISEGGEHA